MSKRWSFSDDAFLHAFYDAVGDYVGEHDLGRKKGAATRRVAKLKKLGGWAALDAIAEARQSYFEAMHPGYGFPIWEDDEDGAA